MNNFEELRQNLEEILDKEDIVILTPSAIVDKEFQQKIWQVSSSLDFKYVLDKEIDLQYGYYNTIKPVLCNSNKIICFNDVLRSIRAKSNSIDAKVRSLTQDEGKTIWRSEKIKGLSSILKNFAECLHDTRKELDYDRKIYDPLYDCINLLRNKESPPKENLKYNDDFSKVFFVRFY